MPTSTGHKARTAPELLAQQELRAKPRSHAIRYWPSSIRRTTTRTLLGQPTRLARPACVNRAPPSARFVAHVCLLHRVCPLSRSLLGVKRTCLCTCLLLTQSGHRCDYLSIPQSDPIRWRILGLVGGSEAARILKRACWCCAGLASCRPRTGANSTGRRSCDHAAWRP